MKKSNVDTLAYYINKYLTDYLPTIRGLSENSILSYRDAFILLLKFIKEEKKIKPETMMMSQLDFDTIIDFVKWMEFDHKIKISSRNQRFIVLRSFIKWVAVSNPQYLLLSKNLNGVHLKKAPVRNMPYLTVNEMEILLNQPDSSTKNGIRDLTMLVLAYDAGARVSEIINLKLKDIRFDAPPLLKIIGKGNKGRSVPLLGQTIKYLKTYFKRWNINPETSKENYVFTSKNKTKFTREGFKYILDKYVKMAKLSNPNFFNEHISPHTLRHSKAMHMLQAGTNIVYIRDILGHSDLSTTEKYAKADNNMKRVALNKAEIKTPEIHKSNIENIQLFNKSIDLDMELWLKNLSK